MVVAMQVYGRVMEHLLVLSMEFLGFLEPISLMAPTLITSIATVLR